MDCEVMASSSRWLEGIISSCNRVQEALVGHICAFPNDSFRSEDVCCNPPRPLVPGTGQNRIHTPQEMSNYSTNNNKYIT
eukprot:3761074-Amphidinium_carterae.1